MRCIKRKLLYGCCRNGLKSVWESCDEGVERLGFLISNLFCGNELCLNFEMSMKWCVLLNKFCVIERPCFCLLQTELWTKRSAPETLFTEFLALKVRANIIIGRTATLCVGGARSKPCVIRSSNSSHM